MDGRIQINNADEKNATVSKLVILRACLYDINRDIRSMNQTYERNKRHDETKASFRASINDLTSANDYWEHRHHFTAQREAVMKQKRDYFVDGVDVFKIGIIVAIIGAIICTALILSGVILVPFFNYEGVYIRLNDPDHEFFLDYAICFVLGLLTGTAMGVGCGLVASAISPVFLYFNVCRQRKANQQEISRKLSKIEAESDEYFKKSGAYDQRVALNNKKIEELRNQIATQDESIRTNKNRIYALQEAIPRKWSFCVKAFSSVLHSSDFENIDYLLYLFITGRADTTKEALQLLDEAKRTEAIIGAINTATQYLVNNFAVALNDLKVSIIGELNSMQSTLNGIKNDIGQMRDDLINIKNSVDMNTIQTMSFATSTRAMLSEIKDNTNKIPKLEYLNGEIVVR